MVSRLAHQTKTIYVGADLINSDSFTFQAYVPFPVNEIIVSDLNVSVFVSDIGANQHGERILFKWNLTAKGDVIGSVLPYTKVLFVNPGALAVTSPTTPTRFVFPLDNPKNVSGTYSVTVARIYDNPAESLFPDVFAAGSTFTPSFKVEFIQYQPTPPFQKIGDEEPKDPRKRHR
jgi:hypothetical protein